MPESVYEALLSGELSRRRLKVERQKPVPLTIDGLAFEEAFRVDLLVCKQVVEIEAREQVAPVHYRQLLTYMKVLDLRVGLRLNFGAATMKEGIHRVVDHYIPPSASSPPLRDEMIRSPVKP